MCICHIYPNQVTSNTYGECMEPYVFDVKPYISSRKASRLLPKRVQSISFVLGIASRPSWTVFTSLPNTSLAWNHSFPPQAKWTIHEVHGVTELPDLPSFAHNRFGIRQELAFKLCVAWVAAMTYVSEVRLNDPQYEANLLLQNTYKLNNRIYRSFVISAGVMHGSFCLCNG
jgi:hypothetical protein